MSAKIKIVLTNKLKSSILNHEEIKKQCRKVFINEVIP